MRIAVVGGYGVFGGRLCRLLQRDGVEVVVAGRTCRAAEEFCASHGGTPLAVDARRDPSPIFAAGPDVVVDAAGPFQAYGSDPYSLPRACIRHGVHYLDLADDAAFVAGIVALDAEARAAGCIVLSGVSSVPALSSAAVEALRKPFSRIALIDSTILPGNRAPRGHSVVQAILGQVGMPLALWRGGAWRTGRCWVQSTIVCLRPDMRRRASLIGAPDLLLFPEHFAARSVLFRAGLELPLLHRGLQLLARLRRVGLFRNTDRLTPLAIGAARLLEGYGSDRGGMTVDVVGETSGRSMRRRWTLIAEAGEGPFVPAVPARAIVANLRSIRPGARPCLAILPLTLFEAAMADLRITTDVTEHAQPPLFQAALGDDWERLHPEAKRLHMVQDLERYSGRAAITRGTHPLARLVAALFRFPAAGADVPVSVTKYRNGSSEIWERDFGGNVFRSTLSPSFPGHVRERFLCFVFQLALPVGDGAMQLTVRRGWFFGIPLPRFLLPVSEAREFVRDGHFRFDVGLHAPLGIGLIVRYRGWLEPDPPG